MAIALSLVIISLIAMYADLSQTHPLIWKVNCVFALLGESKKGDQQGDVALTDNNITEQTIHRYMTGCMPNQLYLTQF